MATVTYPSKICTKCHEEKTLDEFYPRWDGKWGGYYPRCRVCVRKYSKTLRDSNVVFYRDKARVYARMLYSRLSPVFIQRVRKYREDHPERHRAGNVLLEAVSLGEIDRPSKCESCGCSPPRIEGHHQDYTKPLAVMWLCKPCHVIADRVRKEKKYESCVENK